MHHFFEAITNTSGDSLIGYFTRVIDPTNQNTVTLSSDNNGTPIGVVSGVENMAKTDENGNVSFYVESGTYHLDIYAPNATSFILRVSNVAMASGQGPKGDAGPTGSTGPADNTYTTLAALLASDPLRKSARLVPETGETAPAGNFAYIGGAWVRQDATGITAKAPGVGAVPETVDAVLARTPDAKKYGATGAGRVSDLQPIRNLVKAVRRALSDGSRTFTGEVILPPGRYLINGPINLAVDGPITGLTFTGAGAGSTEMVFTTADASISAPGSRDLTFRDIAFRSIDPAVDTDVYVPGALYGVALLQSAFKIAHTFGQDATTLRTWRFDSVTMAGFYKCFDVTGESMCSEFYFDKCSFLQCYYVKDNNNDQAVNWNFFNCNAENEGLDLTGTVGLFRSEAKMLWLKEGDFIQWKGGSIIGYGHLVYHQPLADNIFTDGSHAVVFDGVRIERSDDGGTCTPLWGRAEDGSYVVTGNAPAVTFKDCTVRTLGTIGSNVVHGRVWDGLKLRVQNCQIEAGRVIGVYSSVSAANPATFVCENTGGLTYEDNATGKLSDHIKHSVTINGRDLTLASDQRSDSLTMPYSLSGKGLVVRGPTGNLPLGGTTVNLPAFPKYTVLKRVVVRRFSTGGNPLTVQLRDQADTTTYGEAILATGADRTAAGDINLEVGFQLPVTTPLMLKFIGTPEVIKGAAYVEYD